jgi:hypothetical protein
MHIVLRLLALFCLATLHTGCATIVGNKSFPVSFVSEPSGAKVEVKDNEGVVHFTGTTPATAELRGGNGYFTRGRYTVTTTKDGYTPATQQINASLNGWYWGNILFGGLIGMLIVDPVSGAMYEINTQNVTLSMTPTLGSGTVSLTPASLSNELELADRLLKLKRLREEGVLTESEYQSKKRAILKEM